ncbi:MAG: HAD-IIB family hydrolase [Sphingomonas sp.]|uniref:HAD-IIB family hydrolase n=1 Tax=Sphingomonas sp. TaxID=28214 RepID=UPI001AD54022|nr:HAD-IIB family hydrolase [Sphingomonas sp.]MBN8807297.1 HAD-IIB family hydrolase [Sphingomonas sp.]
MKKLIAFDLDGTLALSKQPLDDRMANALADLLDVAKVDIISGGDWPQFEKQVVGRMIDRANLTNLFIQPTTGTKLYRYVDGAWQAIYAELFSDDERKHIIAAFDQAMHEEGLDQGKTWGERVEDRGSQVTFSALGQQAPLEAKDAWDPDHAKRKKLQARLRNLLPDLSINIGGATSIDITRKGVDKQYGLRKLLPEAGVSADEVLFLGDAIFPGGNDYPAKEMGLDTIKVESIEDTRRVIETIVLVLKD